MIRHLEIAESTWNRWRAQYGGVKADEAKRLRQLETENARLKKLLAEAELDKAMLKELARETYNSGAPSSGRGALVDRFGVSERRACAVTGQWRSTQRLWPDPLKSVHP